MEKIFSCFLLLLLFLSQAASLTAVTDRRTTYIVHVSSSLQPSTSPTPLHRYSRTVRSLPRHLRRPIGRIIYTYDRVAVGFAARLTGPQAAALSLLPHILAVTPDSARFTHTTYTPSFLHLTPSFGLWPRSSFATSVVVAVLDTGIFPYSRSFINPNISLLLPPSTVPAIFSIHRPQVPATTSSWAPSSSTKAMSPPWATPSMKLGNPNHHWTPRATEPTLRQ